MEYEAHILQLVAGHPSIPPVIAYGRFEHFEYLALELLGPSLGDAIRKEGKLPLQDVLRIADQMVRTAFYLQPTSKERIVCGSSPLSSIFMVVKSFTVM
jgi:serine/threonine protein kinase